MNYPYEDLFRIGFGPATDTRDLINTLFPLAIPMGPPPPVTTQSLPPGQVPQGLSRIGPATGTRDLISAMFPLPGAGEPPPGAGGPLAGAMGPFPGEGELPPGEMGPPPPVTTQGPLPGQVPQNPPEGRPPFPSFQESEIIDIAPLSAAEKETEGMISALPKEVPFRSPMNREAAIVTALFALFGGPQARALATGIAQGAVQQGLATQQQKMRNVEVTRQALQEKLDYIRNQKATAEMFNARIRADMPLKRFEAELAEYNAKVEELRYEAERAQREGKEEEARELTIRANVLGSSVLKDLLTASRTVSTFEEFNSVRNRFIDNGTGLYKTYGGKDEVGFRRILESFIPSLTEEEYNQKYRQVLLPGEFYTMERGISEREKLPYVIDNLIRTGKLTEVRTKYLGEQALVVGPLAASKIRASDGRLELSRKEIANNTKSFNSPNLNPKDRASFAMRLSGLYEGAAKDNSEDIETLTKELNVYQNKAYRARALGNMDEAAAYFAEADRVQKGINAARMTRIENMALAKYYREEAGKLVRSGGNTSGGNTTKKNTSPNNPMGLTLPR